MDNDLVIIVDDPEIQKEAKGFDALHKEFLEKQKRNYFALQIEDANAAANRIKSPGSMLAQINATIESYDNQPYHQNAEQGGRIRFGRYDEFGEPIIDEGTYIGPIPLHDEDTF